MTFNYRSIDENGAGGEDFKMPPVLVSGGSPAGGTPAGNQSGQKPAREIKTDVEHSGDDWDDFKIAPLYGAIVDHQKHAKWKHNEAVTTLREWARTLMKMCKIRVKDATYTGVPLIRIEPMNVRTIGVYRGKADGYAIGGTIAINEERFFELPLHMMLALLLKLLFCARRHEEGGDGTFDQDCREKMKAAGLVITDDGAIIIDKDGTFQRFLKSGGIDAPLESKFPQPSRKGKTTNHVWSCTCQRVRVGTKGFFAVCTQCHERFRLGDHVGKRFVNTDNSAALVRV